MMLTAHNLSRLATIDVRELVGAAIVGALLFVAGCAPQPASTSQLPKATAPLGDVPEITSENEEGFVDLVFAIAEHKSLADGSQSIKAAGRHKGQAVGFE